MMRIPFLKPSLVKKERYLAYLDQIDESQLYSNFGPLNSRFEQSVLDGCFDGQGGVTTVANATLGLMLAISASRRPHGRYAVMPSFTFPATPLAAMWCGLEPYFVDIRESDWCLSEPLVEAAIRDLGDQVAVVVPYPVFGTHIDIRYYSGLLKRGIPVVIDAAASFGTRNDGEHFGKGFEGAVVFSFHATKPFGIGEGGLVYSANPELAETIRRGSNFGFDSSRVSVMPGLNAKCSEYAAAVALATLGEFGQKVDHRIGLFATYADKLNRHGLLGKGWEIQSVSGAVPQQIMSVLCPEGGEGREVTARMDTLGIQCRNYFYPGCHRQPQFLECPHADLPVTERVSRRIVSLPFWEDMDEATVETVVAALAGATEQLAAGPER